METLSAAIREKHPRENQCGHIDEALGALGLRRVRGIDGYLLSPVSSIPSKVADLLQLGTRRCIDVAESAIREINREALNSACILTRAVLETACLMLYISQQVRHAVQDPKEADLAKLNTFITDTLVGSGPKAKTFIFMEGHRVTNILTIMEKLDKELKTPFLGFYEGLSEHSHPNAHGMVLTYADTHKACVTTYTDQKESRTRVSLGMAISALETSVRISEMANEHWDKDRQAFILLQEKEIFEAGEWPKGIPHPIPRRSDGTFPTK